MDDAMPMGIFQSVCHFSHKLSRPHKVEPAITQPSGQRHPFDKLFDQKIRPVGRLADIEQRDDAGMLELCGASRFAHQSIDILFAGQTAGPQDLDRHHTVELRYRELETHGRTSRSPILPAVRTCPAAAALRPTR